MQLPGISEGWKEFFASRAHSARCKNLLVQSGTSACCVRTVCVLCGRVNFSVMLQPLNPGTLIVCCVAQWLRTHCFGPDISFCVGQRCFVDRVHLRQLFCPPMGALTLWWTSLLQVYASCNFSTLTTNKSPSWVKPGRLAVDYTTIMGRKWQSLS